MRHDKASQVLELARMLGSSAEGLTLDEMARELDVGRRTAERMRDAVAVVFPQLEIVDDPPTRRFRIPSGLDGLYQAPTAEELAALRRAAEGFAAGGQRSSAAALRGLERKVMSATKAGARRRLAPDLEALVQAEAIAVHAGPRPFEDEAVLGVIREALLAGRMLRFRYQGGRTPGGEREVTPCGLLFARSNYLVAAEGEKEPMNWRLDLVREPMVLQRPAYPPEGFSLQAYADQSFGIYRDAVEDVSLRFRPEAAEGALRWRFHAGQSADVEPDGSVVVRFRASGMRELAWHLFTWGATVQILAPERLRTVLVSELRAALAAHAPEGSQAEPPPAI
ncbi:MAG: WYL domain-containing protein [Proteobacteria bacterium]|nr:WYL domain-containing protein [Pseudomonadota bacterium]